MITDKSRLPIFRLLTLPLCFSLITVSIIHAQDAGTSQIQYVGLLTVDEPFIDLDLDAYPSEPIEFLARFRDYDLSLDGRFVVSRTQISSEAEVFSSSLYVWDLSLGYQETYLPYVNSKILNTEQEALSSFAIAPDSQHIAFFDGDQIKIYSLPALNLVTQSQVFETTQVRRLNVAWSPDNSLIAVAQPDAQLIRVWDWQSNQTYEAEISLQRFSQITGTDSGWVLSQPLTFCDHQLSTCEIYPDDVASNLTSRLVLTSGDSSLAITEFFVGQRVDYTTSFVDIWQLDTDGYQLLQQRQQSDPLFCPMNLSYTGGYAYSNCGSPDSTGIWDLEEDTFLKLFTTNSWTPPLWLSNDYIYFSLDRDFTLTMWDVRETEAIDHLDIRNIDGIVLNELILSDVSNDYRISRNGRILINLGGYLGVFDIGFP